jgi:hypothetical protein
VLTFACSLVVGRCGCIICRYLAELVKFRLAASSSVLLRLKLLLDDFSGSAVDAAAALVESAGRFLLRLPGRYRLGTYHHHTHQSISGPYRAAAMAMSLRRHLVVLLGGSTVSRMLYVICYWVAAQSAACYMLYVA